MQKQTKGSIFLLLCAMIWGSAFVAQSEGMQYVEPFTMGATRFFLAGLVLLPVIAVLDRKGWSQNRPVTKQERKKQFLAGAVCGALLFAASSLQQFGLLSTTVGKSGFVTALYIVFVPILGVFMGKRAGLKVWLCAAIAVFGMYLLCVGSGFSISGGDLLTLGCAVLFTFHICYISAVSPYTDGVRLSCVQFFVCSALSAIGMLLFETPEWGSILQCWWPDRICRRILRRHRLHLPNHRRARRTADAGVAADESGIGICSPVRVAPDWAVALRAGAGWVRDHVRGDPSIAAAGQETGKNIIKCSGAAALYRSFFRYPPFAAMSPTAQSFLSQEKRLGRKEC